MTTLAGVRERPVDGVSAPLRPSRTRRRIAAIAAALLILAWGTLAVWASLDTSNQNGRDVVTGIYHNIGLFVTALPVGKGAIAAVMFFGTSTALLGIACLRLLKLRLPRLDEIALGACLGMAPMTALVLAVGYTAGLATAVLVVSIAAVAIASTVVVWITRPRERQPRRARNMNLFDGALIAAAVGLLIIPFLGALSPESNWDAKWYHLGPPAHFIEHGSFYNTIRATGMTVTGLPSYQETLYTALFGIHGEIAAKLLSFVQLVIVMLLLVVLGRRHLGSIRAGLLAAVAFASIPVVSWSAGTAYADLPVALATTGAMYAALSYRSSRNARWLLLVGVLCGWAYGVKLLGLFTLAAVALVLLWPPGWRREEVRASIQRGLFIAAGTVLGALPGVIRTTASTGSPVFPFLSAIFPTDYWNGFKTDSSREALIHTPVLQLPLTLVRLPYDLVFSADERNTLVGPIFLALIPAIVVAVVVLGRRRTPNLGWLAIVGVVWTVLWLISGLPDSRYLLSVWPLVLLAFAGLAVSVNWRGARVALVALVAVFAMTTAVGSQFLAPVLADSSSYKTTGVTSVSWDYLYRGQSLHEVTLRWLPLVDLINQTVPENGKVYDALGTLYINYLRLRPEVLAGSLQDGPVSLRQWSLCNDDAPWRLADAGVTHVVLNQAQAAALQSSRLWPYLDVTARGDGGDIYRFAVERLGPEPATTKHAFCAGVQGDPRPPSQ